MKDTKIGDIWDNRKAILTGLKNFLIKKDYIEAVYDERKSICESNKCGFNDGKCAVLGTNPCCGACGCSLALKLRDLSEECPKGFWGEIEDYEEKK